MTEPQPDGSEMAQGCMAPLVFRPRQVGRLITLLTLLSLALLSVLGHQSVPYGAAGAAQLAPGGPRLPSHAAVLLGLGAWLLTALLRGAPRLTLSPDGLALRGLFRTRRAAWSSLGQFTVVSGRRGLRGRGPVSASAPILGGRGRIMLPDAFTVKLPAVLEAVAAFHRGLGPSLPPVVEAQIRPVGVPGFRFAWMTLALLAVFAGVFALEQRLAITPGRPGLAPSVPTLVAMGGLNWRLVQAGQWFRPLTAPFLHAGLAHLTGNAIAFVLAGYGLERLVGRGWTFVIFGAGALAGSGMSLLVTAPGVVSVGASGGIMAMLVALFAVSFRMPAGRMRLMAQTQSLRIAIPALLPVSRGAAAMHVDYGAHLGGALFGLATGLFLLRLWGREMPLPRLTRAASVAALLGLACFVAAAVAAALEYRAATAVLADRPA